MKKVVVTGGAGFIGSHLAEALAASYQVSILDDLSTGSLVNVRHLLGKPQVHFIQGSILDLVLLRKTFEGADYVFHLAAAAIVGESLADPLNAFSTNIKGTWNILEACRKNGKVKGVIVASSDKAYGAKNDLPYQENASLNGDHPYDVSKSCADLLAYTYFHTYGLPVSVTRCGNIFGPGDFNFSRIIPDAIKSIVKNKVLQIRSDGKFTRVYV